MKNSSEAAGAKGFRHPNQRRRILQSLTLSMAGAVLGLGIAATVCSADEKHSHLDAQLQDEATSPQTECPVMVGNKIDSSIYVDYKGKRVFFCCKFCQQAFTKNPEKYLDKLPQFSIGNSEPDDGAAAGHHEQDGVDGHPHGLARVIRFVGKFHPIAVHFPIAMIVAAVVAELLGCFPSTGKGLFLNASRFAIFAGALGGIAAVLLGWATGASAHYPPEFSLTFNLHRWMGTSTSLAIVVCAVLCELSYRRDNAALRTGYRVALGVSVVLVCLTGYLGGTLVYGLNYHTW